MANNLIYKVYKKFEKNALFVTVVHFIYCEIMPVLKNKYKPAKYSANKIVNKQNKLENFEDLRVAILCDDMTFENFKDVCAVEFVTPSNWVEVMETFKPHIFFCEATWKGIDQHKSCWRGKVYRNSKIKYENRKVLLQILDYCKKAEIKTVFWNKEDPVFFDNETYNFVDTALKFDYIYTTAEECIEKYKQLGHENVGVLEFGFSPKLFNSRENGKKDYKAVFVGSWYGDLQERCKDMIEIFDMVLSENIPLEIYDRQGNSPNPIHKFPEKYKKYIHPPVDYEKLGKILENATFGININTEKNSQTMFARRVFELMACRCIVISNYSKGIKRLFGNNVWFMGEDFYLDNMEKIRNENYNFVINNCDTKNKFKEACKKVLC